GWKIGWISGRSDLIEAVLAVKQYLTYANGAPFQPAIAKALVDGDEDVAELRDSLAARRDTLIAGLRDIGFDTIVPGGTYFVCADATPFLGPDSPLGEDGASFARALPAELGVAVVPVAAFCRGGSPAASALANWVRFTFVKDEATIRTAI